MQKNYLQFLYIIWSIVGFASCCPDPKLADGGASSSGDAANASVGVRLSQIQTNFFDKHCVTNCHTAVAGASNLSLASGRSHNNLVNVRSQQLTNQWRVLPGQASQSYLIKKMEGTTGIVGEQMPRLAPARPASELNQVREWINKGAPDD